MPGLERRRFLGAFFPASAVVTIFTIGQTVRPLRNRACWRPARPISEFRAFRSTAPRERPACQPTPRSSPDYRLSSSGTSLGPSHSPSTDLHAMPQHTATLPIACVEGWSTTQRWTGIPGTRPPGNGRRAAHAAVHVASLQQARSYKSSELNHWQAHDPDTVLALQVNGETLALYYGYPLRLIGPIDPA